MDVEITIKIEVRKEDFDKRQLIADIRYQFSDITGYDIEEIEVKTDQ